MNALKLIIAREYLAAVKTKAFLWTTLLTPIFMIVVILLPQYLATLSNDDIKQIYVMDRTNVYYPLLESNNDYQFIKMPPYAVPCFLLVYFACRYDKYNVIIV